MSSRGISLTRREAAHDLRVRNLFNRIPQLGHQLPQTRVLPLPPQYDQPEAVGINGKMFEYVTAGFSGYAVVYSPFFDNKIAVASARNFGLVGNGKLFIFDLTPQGIQPAIEYLTQDALYDTAWSEINPNQLVTASGDGTISLYDTTLPDAPIMKWSEHMKEVYAVNWNLVSKDTFVSSSWDGTIKVWSPERPQSIVTLPTHSCTYSATFSPHSPSVVSSVTSDSHLRIFDLRTPAAASNHLVKLIPIHGSAPMPGSNLSANRPVNFPPSEALTHDWNKYRDTVVAVAGVDTLIRTFDIRNSRTPLTILEGHRYAVRRLAWSPHHSDVLLSGSYDMSARVWTDGSAAGQSAFHQPGATPTVGGKQLGQMDRHTEFVTGVDWCLFGGDGWCATTAWDQRLCVWDTRTCLFP